MLENTVVSVNSTAKEYIPWRPWLWKQSWGRVEFSIVSKDWCGDKKLKISEESNWLDERD